MRKSSKVLGAALLVLLVCVSILCLAAWREDRQDFLTVSFLDIGQGDAIFIDAPSGRQMLVDGGPSATVLRRLSEVMPWWDRSIDVVVATHPDIDHTNGLADVFARYRAAYIFLPSVEGVTQDWAATLQGAHAERAQEFIAKRGQIVDLGGGVYAEILFPDRALPSVETNTASAVVRLVYGKTAFLLTGDAPQEIENYLIGLDTSTSFIAGTRLHADVLKAGHHGSKTSSSAAFISAVNPSYVVFSRGCDNKYGHPSKEVVDRVALLGIPTADTCTEGTVTFTSEGRTVVKK